MDKEAAKLQATRLLTHYFAMLFEQAGLTWNSDNVAEMATIVDLVVAAAK
jgi:hypothetical protein